MTKIAISHDEWWFPTVYEIDPSPERVADFWPFNIVDVPAELIERWKRFEAEKDFFTEHLTALVTAAEKEYRSDPEKAKAIDAQIAKALDQRARNQTS